ncbi:MAG: hypothetical protein FWD27_09550 [Coriobacteriia bacterium]|nr:hypothetical protein [Coriobacteriia bacterium]
MKIRYCLVVLGVYVLSNFALPAAAYANPTSTDIASAIMGSDFAPFIYLFVLATAAVLFMIAVAKVKKREATDTDVCFDQGSSDFDAASTELNPYLSIDYSQIETPEELVSYHSQKRTSRAEYAASRRSTHKRYVPRHQKAAAANSEDRAQMPYIRLVPEMKHARRAKAHDKSADKTNELPVLARKIS